VAGVQYGIVLGSEPLALVLVFAASGMALATKPHSFDVLVLLSVFGKLMTSSDVCSCCDCGGKKTLGRAM
jgi:hypothetical protein